MGPETLCSDKRREEILERLVLLVAVLAVNVLLQPASRSAGRVSLETGTRRRRKRDDNVHGLLGGTLEGLEADIALDSLCRLETKSALERRVASRLAKTPGGKEGEDIQR